MTHDHHDHDHDHGHEREHGHAKKIGDIDLPLRPKPAGKEPKEPAQPKVIEDAGTQALSDALKSSFWFVKVIFALLILGLFLSCFRQVHPHEVAVVLRFGKALGSGKEQIKQPGMVFVLPYPIDELVRIPVAGTHTAESKVGWRGLSAEAVLKGEEDVPQEAERLRPGSDGYTLTGDGNIIHVKATVNYTIDDPATYTFEFAHITNLLENIVNNAILYASARTTAADALYENKVAFTEAVRTRIEEKTRTGNLGIKLSLVSVETKVPVAVQQAFNGVQQAVEDRNRQINEARSYESETVNKAMGEAEAVLNRGMAFSNQIVRAVAADAQSFLAQLPLYRSNPQLFQERLLTETTEYVLTNAQDKFFLSTSGDGKARELRINVNREPEQPKLKRYQ